MVPDIALWKDVERVIFVQFVRKNYILYTFFVKIM